MSGYFSSLPSFSNINLSKQLSSLRRVISSGEEVDDPEDEDLSHVSNTLRAYYTEKSRPLPPWLPPDRKTPAANPPALATQASLQGYGGGGGGQGPASSSSSSQPQPPPSRGRGLGDLWGDNSSSRQQASQQPSSLRPVRSANPAQHQAPQPGSSPPPSSSSSSSLKPPQSANLPHRPASSSRSGHSQLDRTHSSNAALESPSARPLPSQRAGSYQASQAAASQQGRPGGDRVPSGGTSAQERLRARLHAGGSSSHGGSSAGGGDGGGYFNRR